MEAEEKEMPDDGGSFDWRTKSKKATFVMIKKMIFVKSSHRTL